MAGDVTTISVITAVKNAAAVLPGCLASVAVQDGIEIEHLVVDGGSTDGTLDLLRSWRDHRIAWTSEPDRGISDAFNKGLARAHGDLVAFLNADDRYAPGALARALSTLSAYPQAGFCFGHCLHRERDGRVWLNLGDPRYATRMRYYMPDVNHPTMVVRRPALEAVGGFDERWRYAMDYDWLLRASAHGVSGVLVDAVQAEMAMGGISDRHWWRAYAEARAIAIRHGASAIPAWIDHLGRLAKGSARRSLTAMGGHRLAHSIRLWRQQRILRRR